LETNVSLFAVTFHGTNRRNFGNFWAIKIGTEYWAVRDGSYPNTSFNKYVINENLMLNCYPREEFWFEVGNTVFAIIYFFLHDILFVLCLLIPLQFEVLPTTEISAIFLHISVRIETPTETLLKLIMKMDLIAT